MRFMRALGGILLGTVVAVIAGAVVDYLRIYPAAEAARIPYLYPWLSGLGGLIGALLAVLLLYPATLRDAGPARPAAKSAAGTKSAATAPSADKMPSFDFDKAREQAAAERKAIDGMSGKEPPK